MRLTLELQKMQVEKEKTDKKNQSYYCEVLNQKFTNYATFANRLTTKKYQKALETYKSKSRDLSKPQDEEPVEEEITEKILEENPSGAFKKKTQPATTLDSTSICLFTNCMFESFEKNLENMRKKFGFFILDEKCCVKKEELIRYLAKMIQKDHMCIYCQQRFKSAESTQNHIKSKQHALMNSEYFGQYERFYDFREENRRIAKEMEERFKHVASNNQLVFMIKNKAESAPAAENEDDEWVDDEESGDMESRTGSDLDDQLIEKYNIRKAQRLETGELLLPSGRIAGNKEYLKFYKQNLRLRDPENPLRKLMADPAMQRKIIREEQALVVRASGYAGAEGQLSLKTYHSFLRNLKKKADKVNNTTYNRLKNDWVRYARIYADWV